MPTTEKERLDRAIIALEGLSVGDSFGEKFFGFREKNFGKDDEIENIIAERIVPRTPWTFTDDTNMALSILEILRRYGKIEQSALAESFVKHFEPSLGYGPSMIGMLFRIREGADWYDEAHKLFEGQGSHGNGAAMRIAPLGAYFADDMNCLLEQAKLSAEVTHTNPEGVAGAIAVAVATAIAYRMRQENLVPSSREFLNEILPYVPNSVVSEKIRHARNLAPNSSVQLAVSALGNGSMVSAQDTVPFALWCASQNLNDYELIDCRLISQSFCG